MSATAIDITEHDNPPDSDADHVIEVRGLVNQFGENRVHDQLDLDVRRGEILGVVGASGTGKSVLLRSIVGLNTPRAGDVRLFGEPQADMVDENNNLKNLRLGVMFQDGALFSSLTVRENIKLAVDEHYDLSDALLHRMSCMKICAGWFAATCGHLVPIGTFRWHAQACGPGTGHGTGPGTVVPG